MNSPERVIVTGGAGFIDFKPYIKIADIFEGWDINTVEGLKMTRKISR